MAFYQDPQDEEEQEDSGAPQIGQESGIISGGPASSSSNSNTAKPDSTGNFVGLQTYLNANKPQAAKLGEQASGIVSSSSDDARNAVTGLNQKFNQAVDQNTVQEDKDAMGLIDTTPEGLSNTQKSQLKKQYGATYGGPNQLSDVDTYGEAMKKANLASQNVGLAGTEEGRSGLVKQINTKPRTQGITAFDQMLLQTGPGRQKLIDVANQNKDVNNLLPQAEQTAAQKAQAAKQTTQATQADTYKKVQDALSNWQKGFEPKLTSARDVGLQNLVTKDLGDIGQGDPYLEGETITELGINPNTRVFRRNLSDYVNSFSPGDVTASNVASPEDYARYGALADLAGIQDPYLNQADASKAGSAPKFSINQQKLMDDLKTDQSSYDNDWNNIRGLVGGSEYLPRGGEGVDPRLKNATMAELVRDWKPVLEQNGQWGPFQKMIDQFQNERGYNNMIKSNLQKYIETAPPGSVRAWV